MKIAEWVTDPQQSGLMMAFGAIAFIIFHWNGTSWGIIIIDCFQLKFNSKIEMKLLLMS